MKERPGCREVIQRWIDSGERSLEDILTFKDRILYSGGLYDQAKKMLREESGNNHPLLKKTRRQILEDTFK